VLNFGAPRDCIAGPLSSYFRRCSAAAVRLGRLLDWECHRERRDRLDARVRDVGDRRLELVVLADRRVIPWRLVDRRANTVVALTDERPRTATLNRASARLERIVRVRHAEHHGDLVAHRRVDIGVEVGIRLAVGVDLLGRSDVLDLHRRSLRRHVA
jgi:hypothetical protein